MGGSFTQDEQGGHAENVTFERADRGERVSYLSGRRAFQTAGTAHAKAQDRSITERKEVRAAGVV